MRIEDREESVLHRSERSEIVRIHGNGLESRVLKVVPRNAASADRVEELRREFALTSSLAGKNLVGCFGLECTDDVWAIHFEDIGGESLATRLGAPALDRESFFAIAIGLAEALASLHARKVLHLAIEPAHVVYAESSRELRVIDFANAIGTQSAFADWERKPRHGVWSAPELRAVARATIDARTDLYGLGATLHGLVHGVPPSATRANPPHASDYLSPSLLELIDALVRVDPTERPSDADSVRRALVALRDGTETSFRTVPPGREIGHAIAAVRASGRGALVVRGDSEEAERAWLVALEHAASHARLAVVRGDRDFEGREAAQAAVTEGAPPVILVLDGETLAHGPTHRLVDLFSRASRNESYVLARRRVATDLGWLESLEPRLRITSVRRDDRTPDRVAIDSLSDDACELLALTALARDPTPLEALANARAVTSTSVAAAIAELVSSQLARPSASPSAPRFAVANEATRRSVLDAIRPERRAELHLRVARALEAISAGDDSPQARATTTAARARAIALHLAAGGTRIATETERRRQLDALVAAIGRAHALGELGTCLALGATLASSCDAEDAARAEGRATRALLDVAGIALDVERPDDARLVLDAARSLARTREDVGRTHGLAMRLALARAQVESAVVELDAATRALEGVSVLRSEVVSLLSAHRAARAACTKELPREPAFGTSSRTLDVLRDALLAEGALPRRVVRACAARATHLALAAGAHPALPLALSLLAREVARLRPDDARRLSSLAVAAATDAPRVVSCRVALTHELSFDRAAPSLRSARLRAIASSAERDGDDATAIDALVRAAVLEIDGGRPLPAVAQVLDASSATLPPSPRLALVAQAIENLRTRDRLAPSELRGPRFEEGEIVEALKERDSELVTLTFAVRSVLSSVFDRRDDSMRFRAAHGLARRADDPLASALGLSFHSALSALDLDRSPVEIASVVLDFLVDARRAGSVAAPRVTTLLAELLARTPLESRAAAVFERAARAAEDRDRRLDAARIHERAARHHGRRGDRVSYEHAIRRARDAYRTIGFDAKVEEIERARPWIREPV